MLADHLPAAQQPFADVAGSLRGAPGALIPRFDVELQAVQPGKRQPPCRHDRQGALRDAAAARGRGNPGTRRWPARRSEATVRSARWRGRCLHGRSQTSTPAATGPVVLPVDERLHRRGLGTGRHGGDRRDHGVGAGLSHQRGIRSGERPQEQRRAVQAGHGQRGGHVDTCLSPPGTNSRRPERERLPRWQTPTSLR